MADCWETLCKRRPLHDKDENSFQTTLLTGEPEMPWMLRIVIWNRHLLFYCLFSIYSSHIQGLHFVILNQKIHKKKVFKKMEFFFLNKTGQPKGALTLNSFLGLDNFEWPLATLCPNLIKSAITVILSIISFRAPFKQLWDNFRTSLRQHRDGIRATLR